MAEILSAFGEPDCQPGTISKKSKIYCFLYKNLSLLVEAGKVIAMDIDFHGKPGFFVLPEEVAGWRRADWVGLSKTQTWQETCIGDATHLGGDGIRLTFSDAGKLAVLSIR